MFKCLLSYLLDLSKLHCFRLIVYELAQQRIGLGTITHYVSVDLGLEAAIQSVK